MPQSPMLEAAPLAGAPRPSTRAVERVVLWSGAEVGRNWMGIARYLQQKTGAEFSLLCLEPKEEAWCRQWWGPLAAHVQEIETLYQGLEDPIESPQALEQQARRAELLYDVLMVDLLQADRHLGLAYATGGVRLHRSRVMRQATYHRSLRLALRALAFFDRYVQERRPDLILLQGVASLHTKCLAVVARKYGIPVRIPLSRLHNLLYWVGDEYYKMPWLDAAYARQPREEDSGSPLPRPVEGPYLASAVRRRKSLRELSLSGTVAACARELAVAGYRSWLGYRRPTGYLVREKMAFRVRAWRRHREWERLSVQASAALQGARYVLYLLQQEPESSLMVRAPEFNNQAAIIDLLARSLPADVRLVVKEHETTGIAARPPGYYRWLSRIPNVQLVSMHLNSIPLIEGSVAVAVITGTAGMEAASLGVPVLSFGRRNAFHLIPHVHVVDRLSEVRPLLAQVCAPEDPGARRARAREGRRFLGALEACAVDMGTSEFFTPGAQISEAKAAAIAELLLSTLQEEGR